MFIECLTVQCKCIYIEYDGESGSAPVQIPVSIKEHFIAFIITVVSTAITIYFVLTINERHNSYLFKSANVEYNYNFSEESSFNDSINDYDYNKLNEI